MKEQALLALQGPKAAAALSRLAPGVEQLGFMTGAAFEIGGAKAWISRSGYTGEDGFEISILARDAEMVATLLADQDEVKPIGLGARDSLRLEAGLPLYGHDLDQHTTPVEADLAFALSKRRRAEGGFPGWDRIARELDDGAIRKRVGLSIEGRQPVREGALVLDAGGKAGQRRGRLRTLQGEQGLLAHMIEHDGARQARFQMLDVAGLGGAVHDHIEMAAAPRDHQIVDDPALGIEQQRVTEPPVLQEGEVGGEQGLQPLFRIRAGDDQLAHMADVEQAGAGARPFMLGHDAFILDGHRIAGERHHAAAAGAVPAVEGKGCCVVAHVPAPGRIGRPHERPEGSNTPSVAGT
jgi:hypothetical protein